MLYSKSTNGFYTPEIHGSNIPSDAVEISDKRYAELLNGNSMGQNISADDDGFPILVDAPLVELTYAEKREREYPPMTDYIDGVVKGDQSQIDAYIAACQAVKAKYPKP